MFQIGDVVKIKTKTKHDYSITRPGTIGIIVRHEYGNCFKFKITKPVHDDLFHFLGSEYDIESDDFELLNPKSIEECIKLIEDKIKSII